MKRPFATLGIYLIASLSAVSLFAQTSYTWSGLGSNRNLSTGANWLGGVAPSGLSTDRLVFPGTAQQNAVLSAALTIGGLSFNDLQSGFYLRSPDGNRPALTLAGNVSTNANSTYWSVLDVPLILSIGAHTFDVAGADLYLWGPLSGSGRIVKNGAGNLYLDNQDYTNTPNTTTGGIVINRGTLFVSNSNSLGSGVVSLNNGALAGYSSVGSTTPITLANNFFLGTNATFGSTNSPQPSLVLTGSVRALGSSVALNLRGGQTLTVRGNIAEDAPSSYSFSGGTYILAGSNSYTGGSTVNSRVFFDTASSVPATGLIKTGAEGYVGFRDATGGTANFITQLDKTNFAGTFGFDSAAAPQAFSGAIDLTGFAPGIAFGTQSNAILYGNITPQAGAAAYQFSGNGNLFLRDETAQPSYGLSGARGVSVTSHTSTDQPLLVVLSRAAANTYTGNIFADSAGLVLDSAGALPANSFINLSGNGGYIGYTEAAGLTPATLVSKLATYNDSSVIGFDSHDSINNLAYPSGPSHLATPSTVTISNLDLSTLTSPLYVGTASHATLAGTVQTTNNNTDDYRFTGYSHGELIVDAQLTGIGRKVIVGLPGLVTHSASVAPFVQLNNVGNNYTGGSELRSGKLILNDNGVLGSGALTVDTAGVAYLATGGTAIVLTNNIVLQSGTVEFAPFDSLQVSGSISGAGAMAYSGSAGGPLTISANNTFTGGSHFRDFAAVDVTTDTGLGAGSVELSVASTLNFRSANPILGSLLNGSGYDGDGSFQSELRFHHVDPTTVTINQTVAADFAGDFYQDGGTASLVKKGAASLTLHGTNNFTGSTTIDEGKLIAGNSGAFGTGTIIINGGSLAATTGATLSNAIAFGVNGGTLSGNGTFTVPIIAGTNVTLAPGFSPGLLTFSSGLTLASGATLEMEIVSASGAAGTGYDSIAVSGSPLDITATSASQFTLKVLSLNLANASGDVSDFNSSSSYSWIFATSAAGITGFDGAKFLIDASGFTNDLNGGSFSLLQGVNGNDPALLLNFTPVPEASTYLLMLLGLSPVAIGAWRRRQRK